MNMAIIKITNEFVEELDEYGIGFMESISELGFTLINERKEDEDDDIITYDVKELEGIDGELLLRFAKDMETDEVFLIEYEII